MYSVRTASIPIEIRTEHLPNTNIERPLPTNLLAVMFHDVGQGDSGSDIFWTASNSLVAVLLVVMVTRNFDYA
jgi:hypothetical protein